jgi:hypothetical protein
MSVERSLVFWNSRGPELTHVLSSLPLRKTPCSSSTFPFRINASAFHPKLSKRDVPMSFSNLSDVSKKTHSKTARSILRDKCSACLCSGRQFACGDVLETFDDCLQTVSRVVGNVCTVFHEPLCPTITVSMNLQWIRRVAYLRTSGRADARNGGFVDGRHPHAASSRLSWAWLVMAFG